ncbi:MAG: prolyl oligopeptidase family serine peptidase [Gemmatimonadales bacterium]|nr:prolyl oligopeptidase family serine peptidase [Gemmatimonadales bacterium]
MRSTISRALSLLTLLATACGGDDDGPSGPVDEGEAPAAGCSGGTLSSGALYRFCFPPDWNGELVLYAHGYVRDDAPLAVPADAPGGIPIAAAVNSLGYAFATTSYRANGLVADVAVDDLIDLDERFRESYRPDPTVTFVVGVSEGGLVAALAAERDPERFSGALAACGPVGDFAAQIDYFGDFRALFDYFFPGFLPGSPVEVPDELRANWESQYVPQILAAVESNPDAASQLIEVTGAAVDGGDLSSVAATVVAVLWYSVFGTENAQERLGGQPYDNVGRVYARYAADPAARDAFGRFDTSGELVVPVVTLHTTGDPEVPFFHEPLYGAKVAAAGAAGLLTQQTVQRYGHCTFELAEVQSAFATLVQQVSTAVAVRP